MARETPAKDFLPQSRLRLLEEDVRESMPLPAQGDDGVVGKIQAPPRASRALALLPVLALFGWADLLVVPGMCTWNQDDWGAVLVYAMFGLITAQFAVVAAWLAWGEPVFWQRLLMVGGLALVYIPAWMLGICIGNQLDGYGFRFRRHEEDLIYAVILLLPPVTLALAIPLQAMRGLFGWRVCFAGAEPSSSRPLAIGDMLVAMAVVAAALTCARMAKHVAGDANESEFWLGLGLGTACAGVASASLILPATWISFRVRNILTGVAAIGLFCGLATAALWITAALVFRQSLDLPLWEIMGLLITGSIGMYTVGGVVLLARWAGYRLVTRRSPAT